MVTITRVGEHDCQLPLLSVKNTTHMEGAFASVRKEAQRSLLSARPKQ
jgi:hypothetical protein